MAYGYDLGLLADLYNMSFSVIEYEWFFCSGPTRVIHQVFVALWFYGYRPT